LVPLRLINSLKRKKAVLPDNRPLYYLYSILLGLAGFWVASFFIDRLYFEGVYLVAALIHPLCRIIRQSASDDGAPARGHC